MGTPERFSYPRPAVRPLKIYAFDPMEGRNSATRISVDTRNEPLDIGPHGARIQVIDYDARQRCFYAPVDLNDPAVLMQGGIDHSESDPRFHQQMVYAVAMRILEVFDRALGRPIDLGTTPDGRTQPLRIFPHAFEGRNALFDPKLGAVLFGYFRVAEKSPGEFVAGQTIYTCLSHDIVAHEFTHALIERLCPDLSKRATPDSLALHEGLADLVLLLHRFSITPVLRDEIRRTRGTLGYDSPFVKIAAQFAAALGKKHGLRNPMEPAKDKSYEDTLQPHERGTLIMAAFFEALFETYRGRVADLFQIARLQWGSDGDALHPDLVNRMADEASRTALSVLTMCIRAFDYLPPFDITFGDFLRATVTADRELAPNDTFHQRANLIDAFRSRGIPVGTERRPRSLTEESLVWEGPARPVPRLPDAISALTPAAQAFARIRPEFGEKSVGTELDDQAKDALKKYAERHAKRLHLDADVEVEVFRPRHSFRVSPDGQLVIDIIAHLTQTLPSRSGIKQQGVTIVAAADGTIRYVIPNEKRRVAQIDDMPGTESLAPDEAPSQPKRSIPPFDKRYRLSEAAYRRRYRSLSLTGNDLHALHEHDAIYR